MSTYASFQGRVYLGKRDTAGNPVEVRSPGNVAELKLALKTDVLEHYLCARAGGRRDCR